MKSATIISVGDELVLGQTVDTNSAWLSRELAKIGFGCDRHVTVGDDQKAIEDAIADAADRSDVVLISGGLGPTEDDLTRQALARVMGVELEMNVSWLGVLEKFFKDRGRPMPESNKIQAMIPAGAEMIHNHAGTAAGIRAIIRRQGRDVEVVVMPGVPKEMMTMFERDVLPGLREQGGGACILSRTLHTFGMGESAVGEKLGPLMMRMKNPSVGTTVSGGFVSLRINARFGSPAEAQKALDETDAACRAALGDLIWGMDDETLPGVVGKMLAERGMFVATAESCTAGLLAKFLTDAPGSSAYFKQGWITYSNEAKRERLGIPAEMLNLYGAVSEPVVNAMASGARRIAKAHVALAISGIAGPDGGTPTKPVGTVCIGMAYGEPKSFESTTYARTFNFPGDREMIRNRSAKMALTMLRYHLMGKSMPF